LQVSAGFLALYFTAISIVTSTAYTQASGGMQNWPARGAFNESVLSYYWIQMDILFHEFKVELREEILKAMNAGLLQIGRRLGFEVQLRIEGLPTLNDAKTALHELKSGEKSFTEVMKVFSQNS
jgi:hypothetical protein